MNSHARVVVIGGGVVGVSTLYHLARKGWSDVVLLERKELTSGSTWHAAGLLPLFNMSYSVGQIHKYSVRFYKELQEETGQDVGFKTVSNIRLATNRDRMDEYYQYAGVAETIGVKVNFLTPDQVKEIWPLCNTEGIVGAIQHPDDGYIQPADLTQALAKGARSRGATIHRNTAVIAIERTSGGEWLVKTDRGDITCEHIVSATGNFARRTGAMVGLDIPVIPVEHQYIVTDAHPDIVARKEQGLPEMGVLRGSDGAWYMREERGGLILGPYEKGAPCCYLDGPDDNSEYELFQEDLERLEPHIEDAVNRVPAFGEPTIDMLGVDPRRYGDYATKSFLRKKNEEAYANVFTIHFPDEEREAGRPLRTAPCYDRLKALGAVFGQKFGWERANWFAPEGVPREDDWSFRRSKWFEHIGNECRNVAENVGLLDMSAFAKCRISGPGAEAFLDRLVANRLPKKIGRVGLCHALNSRGGVHSEFTIMRESEDSFYLVSAGAMQRLDHDWLHRHMPDDGSVRFDHLTSQYGVLVIAGPKARTLMERVSDTDFSTEAFPWLTGKWIDAGLAPTMALRVNFVGELGWELHHPIEYQNHIFDALMTAGADLGIRPFGIRAMDSMRMEKSYRLVGTEMSIEYAAYETGLDRFVHPNKGDFIGRDALMQWRERGFENAFVTLEVHDVTDADALGNNPIYQDGRLVGRATSGNYGFRVGKSLALAMVRPDLAIEGSRFDIRILDRMYKATLIAESPYDPENIRLRS